MAIHILPNISRSKSNQAVEFGQLIQYNMKNIFVEKSYTKCGGESIPDSFVKNENWAYLWMNSLKFKTFCFYCMPSGDYQNILILSCRPLAFTHWRAEGGLELVSLRHLLQYFWRKIFLLLYFITWSIFIVCLPLLREILGDVCIVIAC